MRTKHKMMLALLGLATIAAGPSGYKVSGKIALPGTGGWDYVTVDAAARRVYVTHATQVEVLDADSQQPVSKIPDTPGAHGVALAPEFGRGFISAGKADAVIVFDLKTLKPIAQVKTGKKPDAIIYDPATKRVFAMNGESDSATVINAADNSVAGTIALGGGPEFSAADGKGNLWVNIEEKNEVVHIDTQAMQVKHHWPVAPCEAPSSMALDTQNRRLFLGCRNHFMAVVNADSGKVVATYPIGDHVDASAFDPESKLVFHSTGDGNVFVFKQDSADKYTFVEKIATNQGSKTMGLDPKTHRLFVPANQAGSFTVLVLGQ
ncbi:MAG TPA: YncE family protein [Candidatus Dormibacteraeota bacterium]|nr:YncE family protein [Candidatus Dormibacteraeota bacterium]